jgi:membrane-bound metal-dependent hydrolase YbcI (DUF457 family)
MYPLDHFALAYFFAQTLSTFNKEKYSFHLLWFVLIIPDLDLFLIPHISHRGPTHSIISMTSFIVPAFLYFRRGSKYFIALLSHLLADYITYSGIKLMWPLSNKNYVAPRGFHISPKIQLMIEILIFSSALFHIFYSRWRAYSNTGI